MSLRTNLHEIFVGILGSKNVYFQPPPGLIMAYPCIVYEHTNSDTKFADNKPYQYAKRYTVTVIDKNPDSIIPDRIAELPKCIFDRHFMTDNLHHYAFSLYY